MVKDIDKALNYLDETNILYKKANLNKVDKQLKVIEEHYNVKLDEDFKKMYISFESFTNGNLEIYSLKDIKKNNQFIIARLAEREYTYDEFYKVKRMFIAEVEEKIFLKTSTLSYNQVREIVKSPNSITRFEKILNLGIDREKIINSPDLLNQALTRKNFAFALYLLEHGAEFINFTDFAEIEFILKNTDDLNFRTNLKLINYLLEAGADLNKLIYNKKQPQYQIPQFAGILKMKDTPLLHTFKKHFLLQMLSYKPDIHMTNPYNSITIAKIIKKFTETCNVDYTSALNGTYYLHVDNNKTGIQNNLLKRDEFEGYDDILTNTIYDPTQHSFLQVSIIRGNYDLALILLDHDAKLRFDLIKDTELSLVAESVTDGNYSKGLYLFDVLLKKGIILEEKYSEDYQVVYFTKLLKENTNCSTETKKKIISHILSYNENFGKELVNIMEI